MEHDQPENEQSEQSEPIPEAVDPVRNSSRPPGGSGGSEEALTAAGAALSDAVGTMLRIAAERGRRRLGKAATQGRVRMEMRQLKRDRTRMVEKLGREVIHLVEGGEIDHPGLLRGVERIREQDDRIAQAEASPGAGPASEGSEREQKSLDPSQAVE